MNYNVKIKYEGRSNGLNTVITNICQIAKSLNVEPEYIMKYVGYKCGASAEYDEIKNIGWIYDVLQSIELQNVLKMFIDKFILCSQCKLATITLKIYSKMNENQLYEKCRSCGNNKQIKSNNSNYKKMIKYIINDITTGYNTKMVNRFLGERINFKSNEENIMLLFNGYIRIEVKGFDIKSIPVDVINLCISFWCIFENLINNNKWMEYDRNDEDHYDVVPFLDGIYFDHYNQKWRRINNGVTIMNENKKVVMKMGNDNTPFILKTNAISIKPRKVWNVKILNQSTKKKDKMLKIKICIKTEMGLMLKRCDEYHVDIKNNKIISVLLLVQSKYGDGLVLIALNYGEIICVKNSGITIAADCKYYLQFIISNSCCVELIE